MAGTTEKSPNRAYRGPVRRLRVSVVDGVWRVVKDMRAKRMASRPHWAPIENRGFEAGHFVEVIDNDGKVLHRQPIRDPIEHLRFANRRATPVQLPEIDAACDFIVTWRESQEFPKYMIIWPEAPDGTIIDRWSALPAVKFIERTAHAFYRV